MMKYTNLILAVMVVITGLFAASCAKDNSVVPASAGEQVTSADEVAMKQPAPGTYKISKFIDTGDAKLPSSMDTSFSLKLMAS